MSAVARFILAIIVATVTVITLGVVAVIGIGVIEPFAAELSGPPESLGWGNPASNVLTFGAAALLALILVLMIWLVAMPIKEDRRQEVRR